MKGNMRRQQEGSGKKKMELTAEVSYQKDILPKCCMDRTTGDLKGNI